MRNLQNHYKMKDIIEIKRDIEKKAIKSHPNILYI